MELFEKNGEKVKISSPNFESTMRQVLIEKYDIKYDTLIPSSKDRFDEILSNFVKFVRHHHQKVDKNSKKIVQKFPEYYQIKIAYTDLHIRYTKRKSPELEAGTSRPENLQSPLAKRIRLQRYFIFLKL